MSCYHPLKAFRTPTGVVFSELGRFDVLGDIELPCGQCIGCRMRRASDWELRVMHEAQAHERNCFVTLTYEPGKLPPYGSLCHEDFQKFMKRLRKRCGFRVRFYMCGEYGPVNLRPHYHACLFGVDFDDSSLAGKSASGMDFFESPTLTKLWGLGKATVQPLVRETASYCARYIMKKVLGDAAKVAYTRVDADGVMHEVAPDYARMSLKPGIGANFVEEFGSDVYPLDAVVANGVKRRVPRYYDRLARRGAVACDLDDIEYRRVLKGRSRPEEQSEERRKVREAVELARVSKLARSL